MTHSPIDCTLHDYLEMACLFHYDVRISLKEGSSVQGQAVTTTTLPDGSEALELNDDNGALKLPMHTFSVLEVLTPGARFATVNFCDGKRAHG